MKHFTKDDVLEYVAENDVKFIRMQFCDLNGTLRNVSIMPAGLARAFDEGVFFYPSRIDAMVEARGEEMLLHPDPSTFALLPWRPQNGRVARLLCGISYPEGAPYPGDFRAAALRASSRLRGAGLSLHVGLRCSFTLFRLDDDGTPTLIPHDGAGAYAVAPLDRGENVRREVCLILEEMGIQPQSSCHAAGPGQHEFALAPREAAQAADDFVTLDSVMRAVAARNGLHATLMPRPLEGSQRNDLHLSLTLKEAGGDPFAQEAASPRSAAFFAGIAGHLRETFAFLASTTNSYGGQPCEPLRARGDGIELLCADSALNPYLALAVLQEAGLRGIGGEAPPRGSLPASLGEAIGYTRESALCRDALGEECLGACIAHWKRDVGGWAAAPEPKLDWEIRRYFAVL